LYYCITLSKPPFVTFLNCQWFHWFAGLIARQCQQNPNAIIPDPDNCARYFNCSQMFTQPSLVKYQAECDYPLLFNSQTLMCDDFEIVNCGTRMEPKAPCKLSRTLSQNCDVHFFSLDKAKFTVYLKHSSFFIKSRCNCRGQNELEIHNYKGT
jgi:hypothetical protein